MYAQEDTIEDFGSGIYQQSASLVNMSHFIWSKTLELMFEIKVHERQGHHLEFDGYECVDQIFR